MQHPQQHIWNFIKENIDSSINCMLLYVVESNGSSPGRQGFCMATTLTNMCGSIGGGLMEYKLVELAKNKLQNNNTDVEIKKQIHSKSASKNQSGMICSGEQIIALIPISILQKNIIEKITTNLQLNNNSTLVLSNSGIDCLENHTTFNYVFNIDLYDNWIYKEKIGYKNKLTIVGAGHCALALSKLFCSMDFYIEMYDDRNNLNTFLQNNYVHYKQVINTYADLAKHITTQQNHYVVIMTYGYRTDAIAIKALCSMQFTYIGVLGSKTKMKELFVEFEKQGINKNWLNSIYTPIGMAIKSKTPEEIAISIAAQIIEIKNNLQS